MFPIISRTFSIFRRLSIFSNTKFNLVPWLHPRDEEIYDCNFVRRRNIIKLTILGRIFGQIGFWSLRQWIYVQLMLYLWELNWMWIDGGAGCWILRSRSCKPDYPLQSKLFNLKSHRRPSDPHPQQLDAINPLSDISYNFIFNLSPHFLSPFPPNIMEIEMCHNLYH